MRKEIKRKTSFIIISIIYILASAVGIVSYNVLDLGFWWLNLLIADVIATVITFIFSLIFDNASVYDPYWSVQPIVIAFALAFSHKIHTLALLMIIVVTLWGIRLTANWAYTFHGLGHQDWRYSMLKEKTGKLYLFVNFLGIHMFPTLVVYCCVLPVAYAIIFVSKINLLSLIGVCISLLAITLQFISDWQMQKFRKNRDGNFIRIGLWKYSRHPNYLGEILMWWGIGLALLATVPTKYYLLFGAIINTIMFLIISIPMADKRQAKKPGFEQYKQQTRMLIPIRK